MSKIDPSLGFQVSFRSTSWLDQCIRQWGSEWAAPDHGAYIFSNGRKFDSTDRGTTGVYGVSYTQRLLLDPVN